jgi:hypothetical protein
LRRGITLGAFHPARPAVAGTPARSRLDPATNGCSGRLVPRPAVG